mgnify:CR=1 FL=1
MRKIFLSLILTMMTVSVLAATYEYVDETTGKIVEVVEKIVRVDELQAELDRVNAEIIRTKQVQQQHNDGWNSYIASQERRAIEIGQELDALAAAGVVGEIEEEVTEPVVE